MALRRIPHSRPLVGSAERRAIDRVVRSGRLAGGAEVVKFEREMARALGRRRAVAVSSGTAALHLALRALGVGRGDRVALPSYVCAALLHAVRQADAEPLLVDVDPVSFHLDPDDLRRRLRARTKAIIVAHMFGRAAEMQALESLGAPIVEDCALSLGARYRGRPVGSFGAASVASFYATKMIATGEGGMVLTDGERTFRRLYGSRSYDETPVLGPGFNYKMSEMQAALGRVQLRRLKEFVRRRRRLAALYFRSLADGPWELPVRGRDDVYHRFVLRPGRGARRLLAELDRRGIEARRPVFRPLHRYLGLEGFPGADEAYRRAVSLPLYPSLTPSEANRVVRAARRAGRALRR